MRGPLQVVDLVKRYGDKRALDGVNLDFAPGTLTALVGTNGGGKSTLLRVLAGALKPDGGRVEGLEGVNAAYVPDKLAFGRGWTGRSWLTLVARLKKAPAGAVNRVLAEADLTADQHKAVAAYSQGMQRRLLYAQTNLVPADLVLLDEPEGGLDPHWTLWLEREMDRLRNTRRTVVFSTHWLDLAVDHADRLVVFGQGRIRADEPALDWRPLSTRARRERLARLIEAAP